MSPGSFLWGTQRSLQNTVSHLRSLRIITPATQIGILTCLFLLCLFVCQIMFCEFTIYNYLIGLVSHLYILWLFSFLYFKLKVLNVVVYTKGIKLPNNLCNNNSIIMNLLSIFNTFGFNASCYCFCSHFDSTDCVSDLRCTRQSFESRMNIMNMNSVTSHHSSKWVFFSVLSLTHEREHIIYALYDLTSHAHVLITLLTKQ